MYFVVVGVLLATQLSLVAPATSVDEILAECAGKPYNYLIPDPDDCKSFYLCRYEKPVPESCSASFWFDPLRLVCALPGEEPFCPELACSGKTNVFVKDPYECGHYHYCKDGLVNFSSKCESDLVFYEDRQTCTYPTCTELAEQQVEKEEETPTTEDGLQGVNPWRSF